MVLDIDEIITDPYLLRENYIYRDGFVFTSGQEYPVIFNRIVIRVPERARADESRMGYSYRTLEEHIELINHYGIKKAMVICDDLNFILNCPSIEDIEVWPSFGAPSGFDYSVLYEMPNLKSVYCRAMYGDCEQYKASIDYSKIRGLEQITMSDNGHSGYEKVPTLKEIWICGNKKIQDFNSISCSTIIRRATVFSCGIRSLEGIEKQTELSDLTLWHNYSLKNISALAAVSGTLKELAIDACSKIQDFEVLNTLENLEHLYLDGNNKIPNLQFLRNMKKLKVFVCTMNVEDGDLSACMEIPYASCRNRKHYNFKDKDLPKNLLEKKDSGIF